MSKILDLEIDINGIDLSEEDKALSNIAVASKIIQDICMVYSSQIKGLAKNERKLFYDLVKELKEAEVNGSKTIELSDTIVGFIRKCFQEVKLNPTKLLSRVEEKIDAIRNR